MAVLNFGSLNIDHVYRVDHISRPGETIASQDYRIHAGGKGANQSMALARAGADVAHAGAIGEEGAWLRDKLADAGVDVSRIRFSDNAGGHAIIQVDEAGENSIVLHGGSNLEVTRERINAVLSDFGEGDILLLQNEINMISEIIDAADKRGMRVCLNPAPMKKEVEAYPLNKVDILVVNETEGRELSSEAEPEAIVQTLSERYGCTVVLTLGAEGAMLLANDAIEHVPGVKVKNVVDTTAAGDTFMGFFLAGLAEGLEMSVAVELGCRAGAACVARAGAMDSIPARGEI
ncbi:MAG: ribokinase [Candidatus Sumerlaeota bacterium]